MTPEEVKQLIREEMRGKINPEIFQWLTRAAFEEGWRLGGGSQESSHFSDEPKGWRAAWMDSQARSVLIRNGIISGEDSYK